MMDVDCVDYFGTIFNNIPPLLMFAPGEIIKVVQLFHTDLVLLRFYFYVL